MLRRDDVNPLWALGGGALVVVIVLAATIRQDNYQRDLIAGHRCKDAMTALYTPPPSVSTHCSGSGSSQHCYTSYYQADPYLRTLWQCTEEDGDHVEFWRRTARDVSAE